MSRRRRARPPAEMLARLHATPVWGADLFRAQCPCHRRAVRLLLLWYERRLHLICAQRCPEADMLAALGLTPAALRPPPAPARDAPIVLVAGQGRVDAQQLVWAGRLLGRLGTVERAVVHCLSARQQSPPTRAALLAQIFGWVPDRPRPGAGLRAPLHYCGVPRAEYGRKQASLSRALRTLRQKGLVQPQRAPLLLTGKGRLLARVLQRVCRACGHARECTSPVQGNGEPKDKGKVAALPAPTQSRQERKGVPARWGLKDAGNERAGRGTRTGSQVWHSRGERARNSTALPPQVGGAFYLRRRCPDGMPAYPGRPPRCRGQWRATESG